MFIWGGSRRRRLRHSLTQTITSQVIEEPAISSLLFRTKPSHKKSLLFIFHTALHKLFAPSFFKKKTPRLVLSGSGWKRNVFFEFLWLHNWFVICALMAHCVTVICYFSKNKYLVLVLWTRPQHEKKGPLNVYAPLILASGSHELQVFAQSFFPLSQFFSTISTQNDVLVLSPAWWLHRHYEVQLWNTEISKYRNIEGKLKRRVFIRYRTEQNPANT